MCLARAIVVVRTHADKIHTPEWKKLWKNIRQSDRAKQRNEAEVLLKQAALPRDQGCGVAEMQKIQQVLAPEYTLKVHPQEIRGTLMFRGPTYPHGKALHVYYHDQHFDAITTIAVFLGCSYYCEKCDKGFDH
mgnify:CR=1 FL=1